MDNPKHWERFLFWAKYHYNIAWYSVIRISSYKEVFGRPSPTLIDYLVGSYSITPINDLLTERIQLMSTLCSNL